MATQSELRWGVLSWVVKARNSPFKTDLDLISSSLYFFWANTEVLMLALRTNGWKILLKRQCVFVYDTNVLWFGCKTKKSIFNIWMFETLTLRHVTCTSNEWHLAISKNIKTIQYSVTKFVIICTSFIRLVLINSLFLFGR